MDWIGDLGFGLDSIFLLTAGLGWIGNRFNEIELFEDVID